jgi:hypothetical protein
VIERYHFLYSNCATYFHKLFPKQFTCSGISRWSPHMPMSCQRCPDLTDAQEDAAKQIVDTVLGEPPAANACKSMARATGARIVILGLQRKDRPAFSSHLTSVLTPTGGEASEEKSFSFGLNWSVHARRSKIAQALTMGPGLAAAYPLGESGEVRASFAACAPDLLVGSGRPFSNTTAKYRIYCSFALDADQFKKISAIICSQSSLNIASEILEHVSPLTFNAAGVAATHSWLTAGLAATLALGGVAISSRKAQLALRRTASHARGRLRRLHHQMASLHD